MDYRTRHIDEDWHRLIPSRFPPVDVYERFESPELAEAAKALEAKSNPRLGARDGVLSQSPSVSDSSPQLQNWNHAPFAYRNPEGSTFLNPAYGVLEVVRGVRPALAWAVRRREAFLSRTAEATLDVDMRLLVTPVSGDFVDLTDVEIDPEQNRRWELGRQLYEQGFCGVLFRRPEQPRSVALAVFNGACLGRTLQSAHYRFVWDGKRIRSIYDFTDGSEIAPEALLAECEGRQAA